MNKKTPFFLKISEITESDSSFERCIKMNYTNRRLWGEQSQTDCFRIYERDVQGYPIAIDYYAGRLCVQYFAQNKADAQPSSNFEDETTEGLCKIFGIKPYKVYWRTRAKSKETRQYEKLDASKEFFTVQEYGVTFKVNLKDYLDTGLFLDHRETRRIVASLSKGKRLLNLFAYTCSFSVHAAIAGAVFTKSVDLSNTYTGWGRDNFELNALSAKSNPIIRADCLRFLDDEVRAGAKYDLIVIDPPTISRSKKMLRMFDVQKDYVFLISRALQLLNPQGSIFFSTNLRKFVFDETQFMHCSIVEISDQTIPVDFKSTDIHRCWKITRTS